MTQRITRDLLEARLSALKSVAEHYGVDGFEDATLYEQNDGITLYLEEGRRFTENVKKREMGYILSAVIHTLYTLGKEAGE